MSEKFRNVFLQPLMIGHVVLLTTWLLILAFLAHFQFTIPWQTGLVAWAAGWSAWTLAEYLFNRYLLHLPGSKNQILNSVIEFHLQHHNDPDNIQFIFVHPLLIGASVLPVMVGSITAAGGAGLLVTSGFLFGYLWFILVHTLEHHYRAPAIPWLKDLWENHYLHHKFSEHAAYGVSTSLWDRLFRSLPPKQIFMAVDPVNMKAATSYKVVEVNDKLTEKIFLDLPASIYPEDKNWIPPIQSEIRNIFNPMVNPYTTHGSAKRWILVDQWGAAWGRIAAFVDFQKMLQDGQWMGGIGFFECKADKSAAFLLFDTAVGWLVEYFNVTAVEGPINFGENDKYWGLLIDGFKRPSYGMNYNPPSYRGFFEEYGFQIQYRQITNRLDLHKPLPDRLRRIGERVTSNPNYSFRSFRKSKTGGFINDFLTVYNEAWSSFTNFHPMTKAGV
ncbi:MAG TPA: sterol desaturase family protein, partial [Chryseosolibacter sp.]